MAEGYSTPGAEPASVDTELATKVSMTDPKVTGKTIAVGVTAMLLDASGKALIATGTTLPADAGALYAKGCLFIDTDVATGTSGLYVNIGTAASCVFKLVTNAA